MCCRILVACFLVGLFVQSGGRGGDQQKDDQQKTAIAALEKSGAILVRDNQGHVTTILLGKDSSSRKSLKHLASFPHLRGLTIRKSSLRKKDFSSLKSLDRLQMLVLQDCQLSGNALSNLAESTSVQDVMLQNVNAGDDDIMQLAKIKTLAYLDLKDTEVTVVGLGRFQAARPEVSLRVRPGPTDERPVTDSIEQFGGKVKLNKKGNVLAVNLSATKIADEDLKIFRWLTDLEFLDLRDTKVSGNGLSHLKHSHKLMTLYRKDSKITDAEFAELRRALPSLLYTDDLQDPEDPFVTSDFHVLIPPPPRWKDPKWRPFDRSIDPPKTRMFVRQIVTSTDFEKAAQVENLESLYFVACKIEDEDIPTLGQLPTVKSIYVRDGKLSLASMVQTIDSDWLDQIKTLYLVNVEFVDRGEIGSLTWFHGLSKLTLVGDEFSDDVVPHLGRLPELRELSLVGSNVTDESIAQLSKMSQLKSLYLTQTKISADGIKKLKQALSDCTIYE